MICILYQDLTRGCNPRPTRPILRPSRPPYWARPLSCPPASPSTRHVLTRPVPLPGPSSDPARPPTRPVRIQPGTREREREGWAACSPSLSHPVLRRARLDGGAAGGGSGCVGFKLPHTRAPAAALSRLLPASPPPRLMKISEVKRQGLAGLSRRLGMTRR